MSAENAAEPGVNNSGLPEPKIGKVKITATTKDDLHLGDERVIYGNGNGVHGETDQETGEAYSRPSQAMVTDEVADALVKDGKAKK